MYLKVHFQSFPIIRHSHYFSKRNYTVRYHHNNTIEIAYIVNGTLHVLKDGNELLTVSPGDFFIFSSNQSLTLISDPNIMHIHHTIQLQCVHEAELYDGEYTESSQPEHCFILPMCMKCDESSAHILSRLLELTGKCAAPEGSTDYANILAVLGIFAELSSLYLMSTYHPANDMLPSSLSYRIKHIIAENLHTALSVNDIAKKLKKSPNYINAVFRQTENITILQYINREKVMQIIHHMNIDHMSFRLACEHVGIFDVSYGYRMFKKVTGTTPKLYLEMSYSGTK